MDVGATLGSRRHRSSVAHSEILLTYGRSTGSPLQGSLRKTHRGSRRHLPAAQRPFLCCSKTTFLQDLPLYKFARVCAFWAMEFGRRANALSRCCMALRAIRGRFGIGTGIKIFVPIMLRRQADRARVWRDFVGRFYWKGNIFLSNKRSGFQCSIAVAEYWRGLGRCDCVGFLFG